MIEVSLIWATPVTLGVLGYLWMQFRAERAWKMELEQLRAQVNKQGLLLAALTPKVESLVRVPPNRVVF